MAAVIDAQPAHFVGPLKQGYAPTSSTRCGFPTTRRIRRHGKTQVAARKHKSQVAKPGREWDYEKMLRKRHREIGKKGGFKYAESFKKIKV